MKFNKYLKESFVDEVEAKRIIELIEKNCQPFLKQLNSNNFKNDQLLYSGRDDGVEFSKKKIRKDRKPRDTPLDIHNWIDNWFYEKFKIRARSNTVFCTGDSISADGYNDNKYTIFPIGKFEIIWSDSIKDLYNTALMRKGLDYWKEDFLPHKSKSYKKGNLQSAIKSWHEIMLHCKEYYILKYDAPTNWLVLNHFRDTL